MEPFTSQLVNLNDEQDKPVARAAKVLLETAKNVFFISYSWSMVGDAESGVHDKTLLMASFLCEVSSKFFPESNH